MPSVYRILLAKRVATDLESIFDYIAERSGQNAYRVIDRILDAMNGLKTFPHRTVISGQNPGARQPDSIASRAIMDHLFPS
jgi:plasmid stabilization system protein ParE